MAQDGAWGGPDHSPDLGTGKGEVSRFPSIREAISYCGLCGDEKSSADKVTRTPLSKQRNKHIHVCWWKPRRWRPDRIMFWPWSMKEKNRREC